MSASIELAAERYLPTEVVTGTVEWVLEKAPRRVEVRLIWVTDGRGTREQHTVNFITLTDPRPRDRRAFRLDLPEMPYSFAGQLLQIYWRVEIFMEHPWPPSSTRDGRTISMSPTGIALDPYGHKTE